MQAPIKKPVESKFAIGLGYDSIKFDSLLATASDSSPLFLAKAFPYRVFWIIGAGVDLATTLSTKQSENTISFFQVSPYLQARLLTSDLFSVDPRVYYSVTKQEHAFSSASAQINQVGVGLKIGFQVSDGLLGQFEYRTDSLGSQVVKSHYLIDLSIRQKPNNEKFTFGGGLQAQKLTVIEASNAQYDFEHTALYAMVIF